jgi:hypothetical protein
MQSGNFDALASTDIDLGSILSLHLREMPFDTVVSEPAFTGLIECVVKALQPDLTATFLVRSVRTSFTRDGVVLHHWHVAISKPF